jgi:hypothetical protein
LFHLDECFFLPSFSSGRLDFLLLLFEGNPYIRRSVRVHRLSLRNFVSTCIYNLQCHFNPMFSVTSLFHLLYAFEIYIQQLVWKVAPPLSHLFHDAL